MSDTVLCTARVDGETLESSSSLTCRLAKKRGHHGDREKRDRCSFCRLDDERVVPVYGKECVIIFSMYDLSPFSRNVRDVTMEQQTRQKYVSRFGYLESIRH